MKTLLELLVEDTNVSQELKNILHNKRNKQKNKRKNVRKSIIREHNIR